jgi:uncharacterized protein YqkB
MEFEDSSAQRLSAVLRTNVGGRLVLLVDSEVRAAPAIVNSHVGSRLQSALAVEEAEAERITQLVRSRWSER